MATIRTETMIEAAPAAVWAVLGDFAAGPLRMAPGLVVDCRVEADVRVVTFASGAVARERLVGIDDDERRIAYALVGGSAQPEHDNASMQVVPVGPDRCRFVWIHDVLPADLAPALLDAMQQGSAVITQTLRATTS